MDVTEGGASRPRRWKVIGVFATENSPVDFVPFAYTVGAWPEVATEFWSACKGGCGHWTDIESLCVALNAIVAQVEAKELQYGEELAFQLGDDTLLFLVNVPVPEDRRFEERERLQTYGVDPRVPVSCVTWSCCHRGEG